MSKSIILDRLRRLAEPHNAPKLPSRLPDFPVYSDPVAQFRAELEQVSGVFLDGRAPESLGAALEQVLAQARATEIYWESETLFQKHRIDFRLRDSETFKRRLLAHSHHPLGRVTFPITLHPGPYSRQTLATLTVSASSAVCGIAETGTIVEKAGAGLGRLLPVLPPVHIAFLSQKDILNNPAEFFSSVKPGDESSYRVLVTGPSRTADIEKTLVLGVHGPQRHFVVLTG
jgi:hypothetical protein